MIESGNNKLGINTGGTATGKKIIDIHQSNEYTHINKDKEGMCWGCFSNKAVGATIIEACNDCFEKRGPEPILVTVGINPYGMCQMCGLYRTYIRKLNVRFCLSCGRRYRRHIKKYNKVGGMFGADPFWKKMRRQYGKDYQLLFSQAEGVGI